MNISFIIPTYNEEKVIVDTVKQFATLPRESYEVIVSDNGSNDSTCTLVRPFIDHLIAQPPNLRTTIGECRNRGARVASGEILWFIDADVRIADLNTAADDICQYFQQHPSSVALVMRSMIYREEATRADQIWFCVFNVQLYVLNCMLRTGAAPGDCFIIRRSAFEQVNGFNPNLVTTEDYDLSHRLARIGRIGMLWNRHVEMSPRRIRCDGWTKVLLQWNTNWFRQIVLHRRLGGEWKARR